MTLAGILILPTSEGPFPGVVLLLSGSGPHDRDETVAGHRPFRVLSDRLARAGVAVLRYDNRGIGERTGTFGGATSRDFAADTAATLAFLASRAETGRVGFVANSSSRRATTASERRLIVILQRMPAFDSRIASTCCSLSLTLHLHA